MQAVFDFLKVRTDEAWLIKAQDNLDILLIDHAQCEKKAASNALQLISRYVGHGDLLVKMCQLAREELLHFEQVLGFMQAYNIEFTHLTASGYAQSLRVNTPKDDPARLIHVLIIGAIIEARSCERFYALAKHFETHALYPDLVKYYRFLLKSESRHFLDYLALAKQYAKEPIEPLVDRLLEREAEYIQASDRVFRFHSGIPA